MHKNSYKAIGVMSGTSLDGIDLVACEFVKTKETWGFTFCDVKTISYTPKWRKRLKKAHKVAFTKLLALDKKYGAYLGEEIKVFMDEFNFQPDFIASHGHTIFHEPEKGITRQIGCGEEISRLTQSIVVYDFRIQDVDKGGQGAPLVPIGDQLLFHEYDYCLNLGGFANISFEEQDQRVAFDVCPVNFVLNKFAKKVGDAFDLDGEMASEGHLNEPLFTALNSLDFYQQPFPKSLGREWVKEYLKPILKNTEPIPLRDAMFTFCEHIAFQIAAAVGKEGTLLVTGGGAYHKHLISRMEHYLGKGNKLILPENELIEFKEALIFAFLGLLRVRNEINVLRSVTGATENHSSGKLVYPL